jgi:hypothetical protein
MGNKIMHGHHIRSTDRQIIHEEDTLMWLPRGDLKVKYGQHKPSVTNKISCNKNIAHRNRELMQNMSTI